MAVETERKFLIIRPDPKLLDAQNGLRKLEMIQTYLEYDGNTERRIRKITENGQVTYIHTRKSPVPGEKISRFEEEWEITEEKYLSLMKECISELSKTRCAFPYAGHVIEIDIYPYEIGGDALEGYAVLEVELRSADEEFDLPDFITVIEELTGTKKFSNKAMAKPKRFK